MVTKVLVVHNTAGWYFPIVKEMEKLGYQIDFAINDPGKLGFLDYYKPNNRMKTTSSMVEVQEQLLQLAQEYDIIHVSSIIFHLQVLRHIFPRKKMVIQYHGYEPRAKPKECVYISGLANKTMITTTDLARRLPGVDARYIPHPVDVELFKPRKLSQGAICMYHPMLEKEARDYLKGHEGIDFKPLYAIQYEDVPSLLEDYDTYYDIKFDDDGLVHDPDGDTMSRMAEEALSMGLTVIDGSFRRHVGLPDKYRPENVAKQVDSLYKEIKVC